MKADNEYLYKEVGEKIKQLRKDKHITQSELAKYLNVTQSTIVAIEKGTRKLTLTKIQMLADYFETSVDILLDVDNELEKDSNDVKTGNTIKMLREQHALTLAELSKELDIDISSLANFESGASKILIDILIKFANYFSVIVDSLVGIHIQNEDNPKLERIIIANDPHLRRSYEKWTKEVNESYFSDEELDKLIDYAKYLISQRKKD